MAISTTRLRRPWTREEDEILIRETDLQSSQGSISDWKAIAAKISGRTNKDCRKRWSKICKNINKGVWDKAEDERLQKAVERYGLRWTQVAEVVGSRHADQCAKRWHHSLDPSVDRSEWIEADDQRLLAAVKRYGHRWKTIGDKEFPRRSTTDIKNRYMHFARKGNSTTARFASSRICTASSREPDSEPESSDFSADEIDAEFTPPSEVCSEANAVQQSHEPLLSTLSRGTVVNLNTVNTDSIPDPMGGVVKDTLCNFNFTSQELMQHDDSMLPLWHDDIMTLDTSWDIPDSLGDVSSTSLFSPSASSTSLLPRQDHPTHHTTTIHMIDPVIQGNESDNLDAGDPNRKITLVLEEVDQSSLNGVLDFLFKSKTKFKLEAS